MGLFDFFKSNNSGDITLNMNYKVPEKIYNVKLYEYDKNKSLKIFLINQGLSTKLIDKIMNSKLPFDSAWECFNTTTGTNLDEHISLIKLLIMEGKINNEISSSMLLQISQYLFNYIAMHLDLELPTLRQLSISNRTPFIDGLNKSEVNKVFRMIDYTIFDALAYYSTHENKNLSTICNEMVEIINLNQEIFSRYWNKVGNQNVWIGIIGKIIELAYNNYKPSLSKINIKTVEEKEESISTDFYDFSNLKEIRDPSFQNCYYLEGSNKEKALNDIKKVIDIYNNYVESVGNKKITKADIKGLIEGRSYNNKVTNTFCIHYTPYTPTGKASKNICSISFVINISNSPYLKDGIMYDDDYKSAQYNNSIFGSINYIRDGSISKYNINTDTFSLDGKNIELVITSLEEKIKIVKLDLSSYSSAIANQTSELIVNIEYK